MFKQVFKREVNRIISRPLYLILVLILPLVGFTFFVSFFQKGKPTDLPIAICDLDNSVMSRNLVSMIDATPTCKVDFKVTSAEEGHKLIRTGEVYAMVVIPKNLEKDIYRSNSPQVKNYYNNSYLIAGGLLSKDIVTAVSTLSAGINIGIRQKKSENYKQALASVIPVKLDEHILFNPYTNYFYYLIVCMLPFILQLFVLLISIYSIVVELKYSTVDKWLETAGGNIFTAVIGKFAPYTIVYIVVMLFMNTLMYSFFEIPLQGSTFVIIIAGFLFILAYQFIAIFIVTLRPFTAETLSLGAGFGSMAFTFSGLTFPYEAMPAFSQGFASIFPFSHYLKIVVEQSLRGFSVFSSLSSLGILSIFILIPLLLLPIFKKRIVKQSELNKLA